jgi:hypothetical protein
MGGHSAKARVTCRRLPEIEPHLMNDFALDGMFELF